MARRRKAKKGKIRWLVGLALLSLATGAGFYAWLHQQEAAPAIERLSSLRTNLPSLWTNLSLPERSAEPEANQADETPPPSQPAQPPPSRQPESAPRRVPPPPEETRPPRPVQNILEAQIALARLGISPGCIDGSWGTQTSRALLAYQLHHNLPVSGELDAETMKALQIEEPIHAHYTITEEDLARLMIVPPGWLAKSELERLDYESILELVAEKGRASMTYIRNLNSHVDWGNVSPGTIVRIPRVENPPRAGKPAFIRIHLYSKTMSVFTESTNLVAHFPCSIAAQMEKRPVGRLTVANAAHNPNYLFNPEIFRNSPEAREIGRKLMIPPGPNNPVGTAWIGLDRPGYGIHGTPRPEQIGRTESHGCFRLTNWDAEHLLKLVWVGMPVIITR